MIGDKVIKVKVRIVETLEREESIPINVTSEMTTQEIINSAYKKAWQMYCKEEIILYPEEIVGTSFQVQDPSSLEFIEIV